MGETGGDPSNPFEYSATDAAGRVLIVRIDWNLVTRELLGGSVYREKGCLYRRLLIGVGEDGTPDTAAKAWNFPPGDSNIHQNAFRQVGAATIDDILDSQITAGF